MNLTKEYDLIFVGRLAKNKGANLLLEALVILSKTYNLKPKTLIVGDGPLLKNLKLQTTQLRQGFVGQASYKLQTYVVFHGWAKDSNEVAELINKSRVLIISSYNEGGPRVVLEAMACGVPVLATPVGLVPDLGSAVVKTDWSADDIAKKAKFILDNQPEYTRLSQEGLEIAKKFEKKMMIKNYAERLKEILD